MNQQTINTLAKKIKLLILDNDGVLTDGKIYFNGTEALTLAFHIHDGLGIKNAQAAGITIAIISGRDSSALRQRLAELDITHAFLGQKNKIEAFNTLIETLKLSPDEVAYAGDDLPDIPVMQKVALPISVANAVDAVKNSSLYCTNKSGGQGAVREICDLLIAAKKE